MLEAERAAAVGALIEEAKAIIAAEGVTRQSLKKIESALMRLAAQEHLFPFADFPPPPPGEPSGRRHPVAPRAGRQLRPVHERPQPRQRHQAAQPHHLGGGGGGVGAGTQPPLRTHRRRLGGRARQPAEVGQVVVEPGRGICLLPEDIHSIHTRGTEPTRHLHLYGLALERLDGRLGFDPEAGTVTRYNRAYMQPTANL